jgi:hypothetical protein
MKKFTAFKRLLKGVIASSAVVVSSVAVAGYAGLIFTPPSANFGALAVGSTSAAQIFTVSEDFAPTSATAGFNFTINSITLPSGFIRNGGTCPASGVIANDCTIGIQFRPSIAGVQAGNVVVNATVIGPAQDFNLPVSGQGVVATPLSVNKPLALGALFASLALAGMFFSRRR